MMIKFCWGEEFNEKSAYDLVSFNYDIGTDNPSARSNAIPETVTMRVHIGKDSDKARSGRSFIENAKEQLAMKDDTSKTSGIIRVYRENQVNDSSLVYEVGFKDGWITDIQADLSVRGELPMTMLVVVRPKVITVHGVTLEHFAGPDDRL